MITLKEARLKNNLTQGELARQIDSDQYTVANIELGKTKPRKSTKLKIETALNEQIDWNKTLIDGIIRSSKNRKHEND